ncbi:MAG TPA: hypothetical protein VF272_03050 [Candidatus Saccharimonadia bacterium]
MPKTQHTSMPVSRTRRAGRTLGEWLSDALHAAFGAVLVGLLRMARPSVKNWRKIETPLLDLSYKPLRGKHIETFTADKPTDYWIAALFNNALIRLPKDDANQPFRRMGMAFAAVTALAISLIVLHYGSHTGVSYRELREYFPHVERDTYLMGLGIIKALSVVLALFLWGIMVLMSYLAWTSRSWYIDSLEAELIKVDNKWVAHDFTVKMMWRRLHWKCKETRLSHVDEAKADNDYLKKRYRGRNHIYLRLIDPRGEITKIRILKDIPAADHEPLTDLLTQLGLLYKGGRFSAARQADKFARPEGPVRVSGEVVDEDDKDRRRDEYDRFRS